MSMRSDLGHRTREWGAALPAIITSGALSPPKPRAAAQLVRGFWRFGPTPAMLLAASAARFPDRTAVIDERGGLTYRQLQERVSAIAGALNAMCPSPPRSVGIVCRNHRGFVEATGAGAQLGCELVFINTELPQPQLEALLRRHDPDILIYDEDYQPAVDACAYRGLRVHAWTDGDTTHPTLDRLAQQRNPAPPRVRRAVKITLLTSGTTGLAKGVPRSVNAPAIALLCATAMANTRLRSGDTVLAAPPFFHGFGLVSVLGTLALGGTAVCRRRFDARLAIDDMARHRATVVMAVPVMLQRLLALPDIHRDAKRLSSLRMAVTGASPIPPAAISAFIDVFGPILVNGYGSTEAGLVSMATTADLAESPSTVGRPSLGVSVKILRSDRTMAGVGETGRIFVRSALEYTGYTPDPTQPVAAKEIVDGHVDTGDMGHLDARGRLYIDGRSDDMIVSGGENVFPGEVENVLVAHRALSDAVVVGVEDPEFGQVLHAFVVPANETSPPDVEELKYHVREHLERYKVPKKFVVLKEIPRNASGKVLRAKLDVKKG